MQCIGVSTCCCAGVGGQIDFLRGAAFGYDGLGKPIIAMASVAENGESKIVPYLKTGTYILLRNFPPPSSFTLYFSELLARECFPAAAVICVLT